MTITESREEGEEWLIGIGHVTVTWSIWMKRDQKNKKMYRHELHLKNNSDAGEDWTIIDHYHRNNYHHHSFMFATK